MCKIVKQHTFNLKTKTVLKRELVPHIPGFLPVSPRSIAVAGPLPPISRLRTQPSQGDLLSLSQSWEFFSQTQLPISTGTFSTDPYASFLGLPNKPSSKPVREVFLPELLVITGIKYEHLLIWDLSICLSTLAVTTPQFVYQSLLTSSLNDAGEHCINYLFFLDFSSS